MLRLGLCVVALLGLALPFLAGCGRSGAADAATPLPPVLRVIDGDTIVVGGETIRLVGIDTPEMPSHARCWGEALAGEQARQWLVEFTRYPKSVTILRDYSQRDRYGRTLARVVVDGEDLGEEMVRSGNAALYLGRRWDWCGPMKPGAPGAPKTFSPSR